MERGKRCRLTAYAVGSWGLAMVCLATTCDLGGVGGSVARMGALDTYELADQLHTEEVPDGEQTSFFYFSYDDSASTAALELVKYQLNAGLVPSASLARPWEFLNYEDFDAAETESLGLFEVALGLVERDPRA